MKLSLALIAAAAPAVVSAKRVAAPKTELPAADVKASSKTGNRILSKARRLDGGDGDQTWVAGYSLKFHSCVASQDYYGGYFADQDGNGANNYNYYGNDNANGNYDGEYNANYQNGQYNANAYGDNGDNNYNGNGYYNNEERNDYQGMYQQKLVHFKLCPSDSCWGCKNGADYVVELNDYVDAVLEAKMTAQEYQCEQVRENCYCDGSTSEESCQYSCFTNAGLTECAEAMYDNEFDVQEAVECMQVEVDEDIAKSFYINENRAANEANGYYAQNDENGGDMDKLYVGPYCSANGQKILLGTFREETCSYPAPKGLYEAVNYGESLPYSKKSMVDTKCISCKVPVETDWENYYEQQQEMPEVTDVCSGLYEVAGKCEEGLDGYFPYRDNMGCNFIKTLKSSSILHMPSSANIPAKVFAGIFAVTTAALAALSMVLFKRNRRQNVSLAGDAIIS